MRGIGQDGFERRLVDDLLEVGARVCDAEDDLDHDKEGGGKEDGDEEAHGAVEAEPSPERPDFAVVLVGQELEPAVVATLVKVKVAGDGSRGGEEEGDEGADEDVP